MHSFTKVAALAAITAAPLASAHGFISGIVAGDKWYSGTSPNWVYGEKPDTGGWYAKNQDNGFVEPSSFGSGDVICHKEATVGGAPVPVAAGSSVDLQWNTWPESHHGPVITYMAAVSGEFSAVEKGSLEWFKVTEAGLKDGSSAPGVWATDDLIANNFTASFTVPSDLKAGNYVVRHEIIALHSAGQENGAQDYPQCINFKVTGSGSNVPTGVVGTKLMTSTDPGVLVNIYQAMDSYAIPGPALVGGGGSSNRSITKRVPTHFSA